MMSECKHYESNNSPVVEAIVMKEEWKSGGLYSCLSAPSDCMYIWCCTPCAIGCEPGIGSSLGLYESHVGCSNICTYLFANSNIHGFPVTCNILCDCPCGRKYVDPCWTSHILNSMVHKYNLPYPEPCGERECCDCKLQMYFCGICTLCLIQRELKIRQEFGIQSSNECILKQPQEEVVYSNI